MEVFSVPEGARYILETLNAAGYEAYLVGGCVRDLLRGTVPHDWDVCTTARPEETLACFPGRKVIETGLRHGTAAVALEDGSYEVTTYRSDGAYSDGRRPDSVTFLPELEGDLARRDFTMNAVALSPDGALRDPFGGAGDIERKLIRCVGDPDARFREDGLRIMRAVRFAACLGFELEPRTAAAVHRCKDMLDGVSAERIQSELCRLLTGPGAGRVLRRFPDVFCQFWPELGPLAALEQNNPWHCWGGWEHTVRAVETAPPEPILRLTMLLHDVGKPSCKTTDENGIDHFYGHAGAGAELADSMLRALRFSGADRRRVVELVRLHGVELVPGSRSARRWLNRLGPEEFFQLLAVKRSDNLGQAPELVRERLAALEELRAEAEEILARNQCFSRKDLAVNGRDVLNAGVPAGPEVGRVLERLMERVLSGEVPNRREELLVLIGRKKQAGF